MHAKNASKMTGTDISEGTYLFEKVMVCCKSGLRCYI